MGQAVEDPMTTNVARTRADLSRDVDALYDRVSPGRIVERRKRAASRRLSSIRDSVMGTAREAGSAVHDATQSVQEAASQATDTAAQAGHDTLDRVAQQAQGAPLAAGLVAFGAGMVMAALVPASPVEETAAQRLTDTVKGSPVVDEAKAAAQEVGAHLKDAAGQAVDEVKSSVQDSAAAIKDDAQSATETVKDQVPGA